MPRSWAHFQVAMAELARERSRWQLLAFNAAVMSQAKQEDAERWATLHEGLAGW